MAKANIIIDGAGVTATFNSVAITDILSVSFGMLGERDEIDLTTIDATTYKVGVLGDLVGVSDIVISKKSDPAADMAHSHLNKALSITFRVGKSTSKTYTAWAMLKGVSTGTLERNGSPSVDLTFAVTNLNASLVETGPTIA